MSSMPWSSVEGVMGLLAERVVVIRTLRSWCSAALLTVKWRDDLAMGMGFGGGAVGRQLAKAAPVRAMCSKVQVVSARCRRVLLSVEKLQML